MSLKAIIDKLDDAPETAREHYTERDGKFVLGVEPVGGFSLEDVSGLKSALGKERTSREALEAQVVKFKDLDPDKARAALAELEDFRKIDPAKEADKIVSAKFEAAKAQLLDGHKAEITTRDTRIADLSRAVDGLTRQHQATAAIAAAKGSVELLLPHVLNNTRAVEKDGKWVVEVVKEGVVQIDSAGQPITVEAFVNQMRDSEAFARAFDGDGHSGTGKKPDGGNAVIKGDFGGDRSERAAAISKKFNIPVR